MGVGYILTAADKADPPEPDAKLIVENSQGKLWKRANQPAYAHFSTNIRPGNTSLTVNALLSLPGQALDTKPLIDAADANLRALLAERWPATVDTPLYQIGTTGVRSPVDLGTLSGGVKYGAVIVDGKTVTPERRGIVMAMIDPKTGMVISADGYDTFQLASESDRLAVAIEAAPKGTIVALATYDEGTAQLNDRTRAALASVGAGEQLRDAFGKAYNLIGVKGAAPGTALEKLDTKAITLDVGVGAAQGQPITNFHTELLRYEQDRITLLVQNNQSGLLTLNETYYPGWVAYVDGIATPIIRANGMLRAIVLPSTINGKPHEVTFLYQPISFRLGAAISIVTLALALGILAALAVAAVPRRVGAVVPVAQV